jgi:hypothetical protein
MTPGANIVDLTLTDNAARNGGHDLVSAHSSGRRDSQRQSSALKLLDQRCVENANLLTNPLYRSCGRAICDRDI